MQEFVRIGWSAVLIGSTLNNHQITSLPEEARRVTGFDSGDMS